jgi:magnesium-transporting ATPase (P-type)
MIVQSGYDFANCKIRSSDLLTKEDLIDFQNVMIEWTIFSNLLLAFGFCCTRIPIKRQCSGLKNCCWYTFLGYIYVSMLLQSLVFIIYEMYSIENFSSFGAFQLFLFLVYFCVALYVGADKENRKKVGKIK